MTGPVRPEAQRPGRPRAGAPGGGPPPAGGHGPATGARSPTACPPNCRTGNLVTQAQDQSWRRSWMLMLSPGGGGPMPVPPNPPGSVYPVPPPGNPGNTGQERFIQPADGATGALRWQPTLDYMPNVGRPLRALPGLPLRPVAGLAERDGPQPPLPPGRVRPLRRGRPGALHHARPHPAGGLAATRSCWARPTSATPAPRRGACAGSTSTPATWRATCTSSSPAPSPSTSNCSSGPGPPSPTSTEPLHGADQRAVARRARPGRGGRDPAPGAPVRAGHGLALAAAEGEQPDRAAPGAVAPEPGALRPAVRPGLRRVGPQGDGLGGRLRRGLVPRRHRRPMAAWPRCTAGPCAGSPSRPPGRPRPPRAPLLRPPGGDRRRLGVLRDCKDATGPVLLGLALGAAGADDWPKVPVSLSFLTGLHATLTGAAHAEPGLGDGLMTLGPPNRPGRRRRGHARAARGRRLKGYWCTGWPWTRAGRRCTGSARRPSTPPRSARATWARPR